MMFFSQKMGSQIGRVFSLCILCWCSQYVLSAQYEWEKTSYPNPRVNLEECRSDEPSYVCDTSSVVSEYKATELRYITQDIVDDTYGECGDGGFNVAVAIVDRIVDSRGDYAVDKSERSTMAKGFADYLQKYGWNYAEGCDAVILLSTQDRIIWTSTDIKTNDVLTDECVDQVYDEFLEYSKKDQWGHGLEYMLKEYRKILIGERTCGGWPGWKIAVTVIGSIAGFLLLIFTCWCCCRQGCCEGGGGGGSSSSHWGGWGGGGGGCGGGGGGGGGCGGGGGGDC